ncbi:hypothetical protein BC833DRAFT_450418 [Globomyces pollinis-pini]|nr:hypothetical protein BC833DRAFT_450418 [Globomyces pollinis-pini]
MPFISLILFIGLFLLLGISGEFSNFNVIIFVFYLFIYSVIVKSVFEWYLGFHHGKILDSGIIYAQQLSTQYESVGLQFHFTRGILWVSYTIRT